MSGSRWNYAEYGFKVKQAFKLNLQSFIINILKLKKHLSSW